ncbi:MAG: O-antigen ligase family protein [Pseudomonadota bacterium]
MIWWVWAPAAFVGGKLFAPLIFLGAIFSGPGVIPSLRHRLRADVVLVVLFLLWLTISAWWSPADTSLVTGSLSGGNFSVDAPQIRFGITILAAGVLLVGALAWTEPERSVLTYVLAGSVVFLLLGLLVITPLRETIIENRGAGLLPSAQSVGRAVNLLALSIPLALGVIYGRLQRKTALTVCGLVLILFAVVGLRMGGAAALIGVVVGFGVLAIFWLMPKDGFTRLFDLLAVTVFTAPFLVWGGISLFSGFGGSLPVSAHQRLLIWEATNQRISEKPFFGHGADASTAWHQTFAEAPEWLALMPDNFDLVRIIPGHPHNMALQVWAETGMIGAALLAGAFALLGRRLPPPSELGDVTRIAAAGVFGVGVTLFFVSYSAWDESFWAALAICVAAVISFEKLNKRAT